MAEEEEKQYTAEELEIIQEMQDEEAEDKAEDSMEDDVIGRGTFQDGLDFPTPDPIHNQHTFLDRATFGQDNTLKNTFLHPEEAGRPDFSVRFLLSITTASRQMLDELIIALNKKFPKEKPLTNEIAEYFESKVNNITNSGMSMEGFAMKLNTTKTIDTTKRRSRNIDNLQGGNKNRV